MIFRIILFYRRVANIKNSLIFQGISQATSFLPFFLLLPSHNKEVLTTNLQQQQQQHQFAGQLAQLAALSAAGGIPPGMALPSQVTYTVCKFSQATRTHYVIPPRQKSLVRVVFGFKSFTHKVKFRFSAFKQDNKKKKKHFCWLDFFQELLISNH